MYLRKSFATMTGFAKFANLFPRVTFPVYGMHTRLLSQNSTFMLVLGAATVSRQLLPEWRVRFLLYYKRNGNVIGDEFLCERDKSRNG